MTTQLGRIWDDDDDGWNWPSRYERQLVREIEIVNDEVPPSPRWARFKHNAVCVLCFLWCAGILGAVMFAVVMAK